MFHNTTRNGGGGKTSILHPIYIGFYSHFEDPEDSPGCLMSLVGRYSTPFDHVVLLTHIYGGGKTGKCISISLGKGWCNFLNGGKGVQYGEVSMRINGYSYFRLDMTTENFKKLISLCDRISKQKTTFDIRLQLRLKTIQRPKWDQPQWICSQLIGFLLQECGSLDNDINTSRLSPTDIFLLLNEKYKGGSCESPFSADKKGSTAETVFKKHGGVRLTRDERLLLNESPDPGV